MIPSFESEIRGSLAYALRTALGTAIDPFKIHLPARMADASFRPPQGIDHAGAFAADFGSLWGAPLVDTVRAANGWLLFRFSPAFFHALVERVNTELPLPKQDDGSHAVSRMLTLARHGGCGCPDLPVLRRAMLLALSAHQSPAAYKRAVASAETLFSAIAARERPALMDQSGALGGALARLLFFAAPDA